MILDNSLFVENIAIKLQYFYSIQYRYDRCSFKEY